MTALLVCPVCEEAGDEPCEDVLAEAALAILLVDAQSPSLREESARGGLSAEARLAVPLLVAQPAWPAVLAAARSHDDTTCDPAECDACVSQRSVMQVNCWFWRGVEACAT